MIFKRILSLNLLLLISIVFIAGCNNPPEFLSKFGMGLKWEKYLSKEGMYSCLMPGAVKNKVESQSAGSFIVNYYTSYVEKRSSYYSVTYFDLPEQGDYSNPDAIIDGGLNGFATGIHGTIKTTSNIKMGEYPGKTIEIEVTNNPSIPGKATFYVDSYLIGTRFYMVAVGTLKKTENVSKFMDSFEVSYEPVD
jgi:hypothetical protein